MDCREGPCRSVMRDSPGWRSVRRPTDLVEWKPEWIFPLMQASHRCGVLGTLRPLMLHRLITLTPGCPSLRATFPYLLFHPFGEKRATCACAYSSSNLSRSMGFCVFKPHSLSLFSTTLHTARRQRKIPWTSFVVVREESRETECLRFRRLLTRLSV